MKIKKTLFSIALAGTMVIATIPVMCGKAMADENSNEYTMTIPATLTVTRSGWNATDGITVKAKEGSTFDTEKQIIVRATSGNWWGLESGKNRIDYYMEQSLSMVGYGGRIPRPWQFSGTEVNNGATKGLGIRVNDYSNMPYGVYTDVVTFTANVITPVTSLGINIPSSNRLGNKKMGMRVGEQVQLTANVYPEDASDKTVCWSNSNRSEIVDAHYNTGVATAIKAGTTQVIVQDMGTNTISNRIDVTVYPDTYTFKIPAGQTGYKVLDSNGSAGVGMKFAFTEESNMYPGTFYTRNNIGKFTKIVVMISEDESEEVLWKSELIEPGEEIKSITINKTLESGEYTAILKYECFSLKDESQLNGSDVQLKLLVQ